MKESFIPVLVESTEFHKETETKNCQNCGELLFGPYCKKCGQKDVNFSKPIGTVLLTFFDLWFSFDNRILRSISPLFFKPGYLSAQFVAGKRMSFASPFKLFLFSSICYFFLFNISLKTQGRKYNEWLSKQTSSKQQEAKKMGEELRNTYSTKLAAHPLDTIIQKKTTIASNEITPNNLAGRISKKTKNPEKLRNTLLKGFSYMIFVLMPLFALLLKWSMGKKKQYYIDHLVLSVHFHAFTLLFLSILLIVEMMLDTTIIKLLFPVVILHLIVAIKRFYPVNWAKSIVKSLLILSVYVALFTIALVSTTLIIIAF